MEQNQGGRITGRHYPPLSPGEHPFDGAASERQITINERLFNTNLALMEICRETERFLDRVHPRPPQPTPGTANKPLVERVGPPPLNAVTDMLAETTHRLHDLIAELSRIA